MQQTNYNYFQLNIIKLITVLAYRKWLIGNNFETFNLSTSLNYYKEIEQTHFFLSHLMRF